jgi:hypothetical protein
MTPATSFCACIATNDLAQSSAAVLFACSAWLGGGLAVMHSLSNFQNHERWWVVVVMPVSSTTPFKSPLHPTPIALLLIAKGVANQL